MPPQSRKKQAFQSSETYLLGTSLISIDQLQPHPQQRPLNQPFISNLLKDLKSESPRYNQPIHVIPVADLSADVVERLKGSSDTVEVPKDANFYVINGQHRLEALRKLRLSNYVGGANFYSWPCKIYDPKFAEEDTLKAWMTYMNSIGLSNPTVFMDRILALDAIHSLDKRKEMCSDVTQSAKEAQILKYLVQASFWPEMVLLAERALYRDLTFSHLVALRFHGREADFFKLILKDMIEQHDHLLSLLKKASESNTLTSQEFNDTQGRPITSYDRDTMPMICYRLKDVIEVTGTGTLPCASFGDVLNAVQHRQGSRDGFEAGSPYIFGRMIPRTSDLHNADGKIWGLMERSRIIMNQLVGLLPKGYWPELMIRPATSGPREGQWETWLSLLENSLKNVTGTSEIEQVLAYILRRNEDLFLGCDCELVFKEVYQDMVTRLAPQEKKREAWNNLVDFCMDLQFPFIRKGNKFFPDNTNKVKVKKTVDLTEPEPEPAIVSSDESEYEYGAKKRTVGRGRGKKKKARKKQTAKSVRTIPSHSPAPVNPRSTRSGPSNDEEPKKLSSLSPSDPSSLEVAPSTSKLVLPQNPKVSTGVTPSESSKRKRYVVIEANSNARVTVSMEVGDPVVQNLDSEDIDRKIDVLFERVRKIRRTNEGLAKEVVSQWERVLDARSPDA